MSSSPRFEDAAAGGGDPRYRATLDRLLRGQAYRELGAARLFEDGRALAPTAAAGETLAAHAAEERAHFRAVTVVWAAFAGEPRQALEARAEARLAEQPLPAAASWFDLAMAQFVFDRAGLWQLREYQRCSFAPYRALVAAILSDERAHQDFGADAVVAWCRGRDDAGARGETNAVFARWLGTALRSFGRPDSDGDRYAVAAGLKRRPAAAVMADFLADIRPTVQRAGLTFPEAPALGVALPADLAAALG